MITNPTGTILSPTSPPLCAITLIDRPAACPHPVNRAAPVAACPDRRLAAAARSPVLHIPQPQETAMVATIQTGPHSSAQGPRVTQRADGRHTILTGRGTLTGFPVGMLTPMGV